MLADPGKAEVTPSTCLKPTEWVWKETAKCSYQFSALYPSISPGLNIHIIRESFHTICEAWSEQTGTRHQWVLGVWGSTMQQVVLQMAPQHKQTGLDNIWGHRSRQHFCIAVNSTSKHSFFKCCASYICTVPKDTGAESQQLGSVVDKLDQASLGQEVSLDWWDFLHPSCARHQALAQLQRDSERQDLKQCMPE